MTISKENLFLAILLPSILLGSISVGLPNGVLGSTQPFLANNVGVSKQTINFMWTIGAVGNFIGSFFTGFIFKSFIRGTHSKLYFLSLNILLFGSLLTSVPWQNSFPLLLFTYFSAAFTSISFNTALHSMIVFMLGPKKSRPFLQLVEAFRATGFLLGSLLILPFLPVSDPNTCSEKPTTIDHEEISLPLPFLLVGLSHGFAAITMLLHLCTGQNMPDFCQDQEDDSDCQKIEKLMNPKTILFLAFIFYLLSCGGNAILQSQSFTVGLCGNLKMTPSNAAHLQITYFVCFMIGRFSGVIISNYLQPKVIIIVSITCCLATTIFILSFGRWTVPGLFAGVGVTGFFLAFQFASGFSWLADYLDMSGLNSCIVFLGCSGGFLVSPPLAGVLKSPDEVFYLVLGFTLAQALVVFFLQLLLRGKVSQGNDINSITL